MSDITKTSEMADSPAEQTPHKPSKTGGMQPKTKRLLVCLGFIAITCVGLAFHTGFGSPSMLGINQIATLCPLGAIEVAIASKTIVPVGVLALALIVALILVFGKAFCAWGCPMSLLKRIFGLKQKPEDKAPAPERGGANDSRMWVLGGAVITTAAFGFPVFCLVCPIGLTFGTLVVLWRAIQFGETTWSLIVFPAILIIEVVVLRRWCHTLCPMAALMSLIARGNKTFKATINNSSCIQERGGSCGKCADACPEGIDLHEGAPSTPRFECIKCGECSHACPVQAISFPFLPKKVEQGGTHEKEPVEQ